MVCLKLFGGLSVSREQRPISGPATQRHRLALLALLGASPGAAQGRDKLIGYLWPESDQEHARNLLSQAVHALRKALGEDVIISAGDELRLNTGTLDCDVIAFERAIDSGESRRAVALYTGAFLDGFYLRDSTEFEHWMERHRARLADSYARALESLAESAAMEQDYVQAAEWWKARAALDPYDARVALSLMTSLADSGNPAAALQHATMHQRLLQEDFGATVSQEVLEAAERLRSQPPPAHTARARTTPRGEQLRADAGSVPPPATQSADASAAASGVTAPHSGRWRVLPRRTALAALAVIALLLAVVRLWPRDTMAAPAPTATSLAVLPLATGDPDDASLAAGMTEELIAILAKTGLPVTARTSITGFRNRELDVRTIAESLGVSHLLEGALQKSGSRLRVRLRLVNGRDGATQWSEIYDRDLHDIFAVQEDVGQSVARELGIRFGVEAGSPLRRERTPNVAAYELYLRGSDPALLRSDSGAREKLRHLQGAVALDSTYAAAYAALAKAYLRIRMTDAIDTLYTDLLPLAERAALRALALDDSLADAHYSYGLVRLWSRDYPTAERGFKSALTLDPGSGHAHDALAGLYLATGRRSEALARARRALELDPLSPATHAALARALMANDRCDDALQQLENIEAVRPPLLRAVSVRAHCLARQRRWSEAIATLRPHAERDLSIRALYGYALARAGQRQEAQHVHATLQEHWRRRHRGAAHVAIVYAGLGEMDAAFAWLNRALEDGSLGPMPPNSQALEPIFHELHGDPRFAQLKQRLGLPPR